MPDHLPLCDVCQVRPASVVEGCVELCSACALDGLERRLGEDAPIDELGRQLRDLELVLTADELLLEHGIALR